MLRVERAQRHVVIGQFDFEAQLRRCDHCSGGLGVELRVVRPIPDFAPEVRLPREGRSVTVRRLVARAAPVDAEQAVDGLAVLRCVSLGAQLRKQLRAGLAHDVARLRIGFFGCLKIRVGRIQACFETVEVCIAEHLPPVTLLELRCGIGEPERSRSLVTGGQKHMRSLVGRRQAASGKRHGQRQERGAGKAPRSFEVTHHLGSLSAAAILAC
jgi:hypothetical protein